MVCFDQARKMGEAAGSGAVSNYRNTIKYMKRFVGLAFDDPRAQKEMKRVAFNCVPMKHSLGGPDSVGVKVSVNGEERILPVESVCGMMIHHMGLIAAQKAAETSGMGDIPDLKQFFPQDWVIAIPSYFTDSQRRALLHGCEIVGIPGVQRLIHDNTATALAYGIFKDIRKEFESEKPTNVMFIDLGASQYTVTIVAFEPGKLIVKSSCFDADLGGRDFDQGIANWLADKFVEKFSKKLSSTPQQKPKVMLKLLDAAEKAKKTLSPQGVKEASINLECLMEDLDFNIKLKKDEYEAMSKPLLDRLEGPITKALADAQLKSSDLSSIEIVGGSSRIGFEKKKLMQILNVKILSTTMNADEAVARGAALQSAILSPRFKVLPYEIIDVIPLPIKLSWDEEKGSAAEKGVEVDGDADESNMPTNSVTMFDRGLSFPIVRRVTLRRAGDFAVSSSYDQAAFDHGLEAGVSTDIAEWSIKAPAGEEKKIRVNVKEDIHGIISLSSAQMIEDVEEEGGEEPKEGEEKKKKVKKTNLEFTCTQAFDWTKDEINKFHEVEVELANHDRVVRETADMRNELESYIYDMRDKITSERQLANYGTQAEKDSFDKKQMDVENWLYEEGFDATKSVYASKLAELKKIGGPIEARASEDENRPIAIAAIQKNIEKYKGWLADAQGNEKCAHITEEEFDKCHKACDSTSSWVYDMLDKQGSLAQNVDPAFTIVEVNTKSQELTNVCGPVMHKPAPKPKKEEKKEEKPKEAKPAEETPAEEMEVDETKEDGEKMETEE
jgi:heat shock protein 4